MKKAVFLDIDGTILDTKSDILDITPAVAEAIKGLQGNGHYVFIATGRPYAFLSQSIKDFGFDGFILTNGAQVLINNENIYKAAIDTEFVKKATLEFEKRHIQYMLQSYHYSYMKEHCVEYYEMFESVGITRELLKTEFEVEDVYTQKMQMLCPDMEALEFCKTFLADYPEYDFFHSMGATQFELYAKSFTKATGILEALKHLDIPVERSYAFGDEKNDIEMLSVVGCGIAMGNAPDDVKAYANQVTETVTNDGVAHGIKQFVLVS